MSLKDIVDFSDFVIDSVAAELEAHGIRKAFQYDSYAGKTKFIAVVLSEPIPFQAQDVKHFTHIPSPGVADKIKDFFGLAGSARRLSKFTFRGRIIGPNSPHWFLPDPCDPAYAGGDAESRADLLKLISMHTLFTSTEEYQLQSGKTLPNRGDLVLVELEYNVFGYDLQKGEFRDVVTATDAFTNITNMSPGWQSSVGCREPLQAAFSSAQRSPPPHRQTPHKGAKPVHDPVQPGQPPPVVPKSGPGGPQPGPGLYRPKRVITLPQGMRKCREGELCDGYAQAKFYRTANRGPDDIKLIVVHATAGGGTASGGAMRMQRGPTTPVTCPPKRKDGTGGCPEDQSIMHNDKLRYKCPGFGLCQAQRKPYKIKEVHSSAHYFVDKAGIIIQGVADKDLANHATVANGQSIGIEHVGTTKDPGAWSEELMDASARLAAGLARKYNIPIQMAGISAPAGGCRKLSDPGCGPRGGAYDMWPNEMGYDMSEAQIGVPVVYEPRTPTGAPIEEGFIAHSTIDPVNRSDPGQYWDWDNYLSRVQSYVDKPPPEHRDEHLALAEGEAPGISGVHCKDWIWDDESWADCP